MEPLGGILIEFLSTDPKLPCSISGATRFYEKRGI
jgi:hypothetical protein